MAIYFFEATANAQKQITQLYDFVWPTATGMWNLRWQVAGYVQSVPGATVEQLRSRFSEGADIHGANLRRACIEHTWDQQRETFAGMLLTNTFAVYEGWIEHVLDDLGKNTRTLLKALQFPEDHVKKTGVRSAIADINLNQSNALTNNFYAALCGGPNFAMANLDAMMLCYRFFKEMRNCQMHGGGVADQKLVDAYNNFLPCATAAVLGVGEVPKHAPVVLGGNVNLNLRGVVGFSHIVLKMMATLDAEISKSQAAEKPFIKRWKQKHPQKYIMSGGAEARKQKIKNLLKHAHFPEPSNPKEVETWLKHLNLVSA
jgi:hypothetical protein